MDEKMYYDGTPLEYNATKASVKVRPVSNATYTRSVSEVVMTQFRL